METLHLRLARPRSIPITPVLLWILAPLLIPLMVVMAIVCGIRGEDCSC